MALAVDLLEQLKGELKQHGITYKQVAEAMDISESSVKRLFRDRDMSLSRLESICALMDLDISDLAARSDEARRQIKQLTIEDEEILVGDETLFLIAVHLIYGWTFDQIMDAYDLDEHQAQRHLTTLDRMKVIELMPDNRARILLSAEFEWIIGGPIQTFFEQNLQGHFFNSTFSNPGELRLVTNAWMSLENTLAFHESMRRLVREFELQKAYDKHSPAEKRRGTTLVLAIRPWALEIFEKYMSESNTVGHKYEQ